MGGQHHIIQGVDMQHYNAFDEWLASTALGGANQSYIEELYESYLEDPSSVDESWRATFTSARLFPSFSKRKYNRSRDGYRSRSQCKISQSPPIYQCLSLPRSFRSET